MYVIKVKGKSKIPDYIQLRDDNFILIGYFRLERMRDNFPKFGIHLKEEELKKMIETLPYGKIHEVTPND